VSRLVGDGLAAHFLHDPCCGEVLLGVGFSRLFRLSLQTDGKVGELGVCDGTVWVWNLRWRRPLFVWEDDLLNQLLVVMASHTCVARGTSGPGLIAPMVGTRLSRPIPFFFVVCRLRVPLRVLACRRLLVFGSRGPCRKWLSLIGFLPGSILLGVVSRFRRGAWVCFLCGFV